MSEPLDAEIRLDLIDRPRRPSRLGLDPDALGKLADDIAANGQLQRVGLIGPGPDGRYETAWGDRRCHAMRLLGRGLIAARVYPHGTDPLAVRAAENFQREQLTPLEEAHLVQELRQAGQPLAAVARLLRRSDVWVRERLDLLEMPEELRHAVHAGAVSLGVARTLATVDHDDYRRSLVAEATNTGATVRTADVWVAHYHADRARIVANHLTVQEIVASRNAYVVYYACDACKAEVDYRDTSSFRMCKTCGTELVAALSAAQGGGTQPALPIPAPPTA